MDPQTQVPQEKGHDGRTITIVGGAHLISHMLQLSLPPLFPILHRVFGVGFVELGLIATCFYTASGLGQALIAGPLSDRYGPHRVLLGGLLLQAGAVFLTGLAPVYWVFLPLATLAGLGNCVFHPANLSILSLRITEKRLGRAYAIHALSGSLGFAVAPVLITALAAGTGSWRLALCIPGAVGLAFAGWVYTWRACVRCQGVSAKKGPTGSAAGRSGGWSVILSPVILMGFAYFFLSAFTNNGVQSLGIAALMAAYGWSLSAAAVVVTAYLLGNAAGVAAGGLLAERTDRHHRVAMTGMVVAAGAMLGLFWSGGVSPLIMVLMILGGGSYGVTQPSRDIIIRKAAAGIGLGSVFGFVYSGFDIAMAVGPLVLGAMIDGGWPRQTFLVMAAALLLAVPTVREVRQRSQGKAGSV